MKRNKALKTTFALLLVGAISVVAACKKQPPKTTEQAKPSEAPTTPGPREVAPPPRTTPAPVESSPLSGDLDQLNRAGYLKDAFFDYDKSNIRPDARTTLTADASELKAIFRDFPSAKVTVEGHCDERGSAEYNLALGDRRAREAKDFLVEFGVPAAQLATISYGKERPQCTEHDEACWQRNRRAHLAAGQ